MVAMTLEISNKYKSFFIRTRSDLPDGRNTELVAGEDCLVLVTGGIGCKTGMTNSRDCRT